MRLHEQFGERKCIKCGNDLTNEDVMKIKIEDFWETIFMTICPECFKKEMLELALKRKKIS